MAIACSFVVVGSSFAADLPQRMPVKAAPVPVFVGYSWTGFYYGVNVGYGFADQDTSLITTATGASVANGSASLSGLTTGGQIGYNWQTRNWVLGLEADFQGSWQNEDQTLGAVNFTTRLQWYGSVRARVGWAMDRFLPYITGGWAYGRGQIDGPGFSGNETYSGWVAGVGIESALWDNWTGRLEYLYYDLGDGPSVAATGTAFTVEGSSMQQNVVRLGLNYRF
jgi:outer membrane immunogenic protein